MCPKARIWKYFPIKCGGKQRGLALGWSVLSPNRNNNSIFTSRPHHKTKIILQSLETIQGDRKQGSKFSFLPWFASTSLATVDADTF